LKVGSLLMNIYYNGAKCIKESVMKKLTLILAVMALFGGVATAQAAGEQSAFLEQVNKSMKISGQMASGKIPFNPAKALKEMKNIQKAVVAFQTNEAPKASKNLVDCAALLQKASTKGAAAAKAGQGAFKAAYGDLVTGHKVCASK
jgi:transcriptional regulator GlxA family with amidase domain